MWPLLTLATAERVLPIRQLSNDLFADFFCLGDRHCLGHIRLSGYNDRYFFDEANKDNRPSVACPKCGTRFVYRWTPEGVLLSGPEVPDACQHNWQRSGPVSDGHLFCPNCGGHKDEDGPERPDSRATPEEQGFTPGGERPPSCEQHPEDY